MKLPNRNGSLLFRTAKTRTIVTSNMRAIKLDHAAPSMPSSGAPQLPKMNSQLPITFKTRLTSDTTGPRRVMPTPRRHSTSAACMGKMRYVAPITRR